MTHNTGNILKELPSMDLLLENSRAKNYISDLGREIVKKVLNQVISEKRRDVIEGVSETVSFEDIENSAVALLQKKVKPNLRKVINATGVIVHTNLGRSCLSSKAANAVREAASSYSTLEYDLSTGKRGHRNAHIEWLLCQLTGAEAGLVVNNNAGAVLLCLAALTRDREVIVSRGELVEIGGSFRIPDIMEFSGATLVETGATNRTHLEDYDKKITENTAMLLKVHPSNFKIQGFTSEVARKELSALAREKGLIFMEDLGSGILVDLESFGLSGEPTVKDCIEAGVDIVTFSGDKMLGGPQIGGIAGKKEIIDRLRKFPLLRALRVDKMTLTALEVTLRQYLQSNYNEIPTLRMLNPDMDSMLKSARRLKRRMKKGFPDLNIRIVEVKDAVGGGAFPVTSLSGLGLSISGVPRISAGELQMQLRLCDPPVIAGASENETVIHLRTLLDGDDSLILKAFESILKKGEL